MLCHIKPVCIEQHIDRSYQLLHYVAAGGGVELPAHYPQWKVEYGRMEPPNIILASLNKLVEGN